MYTTVDYIQNKLGDTLTDSQSSYFDSVLDSSIDKFIDSQTHTQFGSEDEVDVYVTGEFSPMLVIPTMHDITEVYVVNDDDTETLIDPTTYSLYPRGDDDKYAIRKIGGMWYEGFENYKVVGKLGFKDIPGDIALVATELAVNAFQSNYNNYASERVGDWAVTYKDMSASLSSESQSILNSYTRLSRSI